MALLLCRKRAVSDKLVEFKPLGGKSNIHDRDSQHWHLGQNKCPLRMKPKTRIRQNVKWIVVIIETIRVGVVHTHGIHGIHPHCSPHPSFPCEKLHKLQFLERAGRFSVAAYWMGNHGKNRQILHLISYIILVYIYCVLLEPWEVGGERHQNHHPDKALSSSSLAVGNWQATRWDQRIIIHQHQHWSWSSMLILESCQYQSCRSSKINTLGCQSRFKNKWFSQETLGAPKAVRRRTTFPMLPLPVAMAPAVYPQTCGSKDTWSFWNPINLKNLAFLIVLNFLKWITPRMILHAPWCYKKKMGSVEVVLQW